MIKNKTIPFALALLVSSVSAQAATFVMEKNNQSFSIDGNGGAIVGQQLYLWDTSLSSPNQNWVQLDRGDGFYAYKKLNTNLCWDGGNAGAKRQPVTLQTCNASNQNQHWRKVKIGSGSETYRFEKRNASGWSIDGNGGAARRQALYLWNSSDSNVNQQWNLTRTDAEPSTPISALFLQHKSSGQYYALNASNQLERIATSTSTAQGLEKVSQGGGFALRAVGGTMSGSYLHEPSGSNRQELTASAAAAEVFFEYACGAGVVYLLSNSTGASLKNESNNQLGNNSGGTCGSAANEFVWVGGTSSSTPSSSAASSSSSSSASSTPSSNTKIPTSITNSSLWDLEGDNPHPLVNDYTLEFVPLQTKVTTPNGNGWRHEYKIASAQRKAMTAVYEQFKATIKVDLSSGGKTIVAQHHAGDTGTIMKLYVSDSSESGFYDSKAANGIFDVYVRIRNTSGVEEKKPLGTIRSGDSFSFEVINNYGVVKVSAFGQNLETRVEDDSASYLKFGNYLQSQYPNGSVDCGTHGNSNSFADCFKAIGITQAKITMTNVTYVRK